MDRLLNIDYHGINIPIRIHFEKRKNSRVSIGKDSIHLRLPKSLNKAQVTNSIEWMQNWLEQTFSKKPGLLERFKQKQYQNGDELIVGSRTYKILIQESNKKLYKGLLNGHTIHITSGAYSSEENHLKNIRSLLSRVVAQDFTPEITQRVHALNEKHIRKKINSVKLKYTHSRWGSCSTNGNINLSTRLLFAPEKVIDYVIIHELAHLIQPNHSSAFWAIVARAMPNYKDQEAWLKEHGSSCDF